MDEVGAHGRPSGPRRGRTRRVGPAVLTAALGVALASSVVPPERPASERPDYLLAPSVGRGAPAITPAHVEQALGSVGLARDLGVEVAVRVLPGNQLAVELGGSITVDADAAGHGWDVVGGTMDLVGALAHEIGHVLGQTHTAGEGLMAPVLHPYESLLGTAPPATDAPDADGAVLDDGALGEPTTTVPTDASAPEPAPGDPVESPPSDGSLDGPSPPPDAGPSDVEPPVSAPAVIGDPAPSAPAAPPADDTAPSTSAPASTAPMGDVPAAPAPEVAADPSLEPAPVGPEDAVPAAVETPTVPDVAALLELTPVPLDVGDTAIEAARTTPGRRDAARDGPGAPGPAGRSPVAAGTSSADPPPPGPAAGPVPVAGWPAFAAAAAAAHDHVWSGRTRAGRTTDPAAAGADGAPPAPHRDDSRPVAALADNPNGAAPLRRRGGGGSTTYSSSAGGSGAGGGPTSLVDVGLALVAAVLALRLRATSITLERSGSLSGFATSVSARGPPAEVAENSAHSIDAAPEARSVPVPASGAASAASPPLIPLGFVVPSGVSCRDHDGARTVLVVDGRRLAVAPPGARHRLVRSERRDSRRGALARRRRPAHRTNRAPTLCVREPGRPASTGESSSAPAPTGLAPAAGLGHVAGNRSGRRPESGGADRTPPRPVAPPPG